jgi:hypothetical protein
MKLKTGKQKLKHGTTKLIKRFAWLPININGDFIWLEKYEVLRAYIGTSYTVSIENKPATFIIFKWITLSKRTI